MTQQLAKKNMKRPYFHANRGLFDPNGHPARTEPAGGGLDPIPAAGAPSAAYLQTRGTICAAACLGSAWE
jgi:hypothetical protein